MPRLCFQANGYLLPSSLRFTRQTSRHTGLHAISSHFCCCRRTFKARFVFPGLQGKSKSKNSAPPSMCERPRRPPTHLLHPPTLFHILGRDKQREIFANIFKYRFSQTECRKGRGSFLRFPMQISILRVFWELVKYLDIRLIPLLFFSRYHHLIQENS